MTPGFIMYPVKPQGEERVQERHRNDAGTSFGKIDRHQKGRGK
jgi:hypothetical protein